MAGQDLVPDTVPAAIRTYGIDKVMNYQFSDCFCCCCCPILYAGVTVKIVMAWHNYKLYLYFIIASVEHREHCQTLPLITLSIS